MKFNEKDIIFNYQVCVTISEQAYDSLLLNNGLQQRYVISQGFISVENMCKLQQIH